MPITEDEIKAITRIMNDADGGCPVCASSLINSLIDKFPEYKEIIVQTYRDEYGYDPDIEQ